MFAMIGSAKKYIFEKCFMSNIVNNDFANESSDYQTIRIVYKNGRDGVDYAFTLNFAKELCMLSLCENGKLARLYMNRCFSAMSGNGFKIIEI